MTEDESQNWVELARARMAARGKRRPSTKIGAVRALWPMIDVALTNGQSLKRIREWLEEEGISLTYNQLTSYVGRIRRKANKTATAQPEADKGKTGPSQAAITIVERLESKTPESISLHDPIANIRNRERQRPTFEYDPNFNEDELV